MQDDRTGRQLRWTDRAGPVPGAGAERRDRDPAHRRNDPRHDQSRKSFRLPDRNDRRHPRLLRALPRDVPRAQARCARRHRRRWHAQHRPRFWQLGIPLVGVPKTIDNDIVGNHQHVRLRHRGRLRDRCHRSPPHHGRSAPPRHGGRGHGALCGMDCALRRRRRRRRRHPDSGDPVRPVESREAHRRPRHVRRALQHRRRG